MMDEQCRNRLKELCKKWDEYRCDYYNNRDYENGFEAGIFHACEDLKDVIDDETNGND